MFPSDALIKAGIFPNKYILSANTLELWAEFQIGVANRSESEGRVRDWFTSYHNDDLASVYVTEQYIPVKSMETLLVLLTMDEQDVFFEEESDYDEDQTVP